EPTMCAAFQSNDRIGFKFCYTDRADGAPFPSHELDALLFTSPEGDSVARSGWRAISAASAVELGKHHHSHYYQRCYVIARKPMPSWWRGASLHLPFSRPSQKIL